MHTNYELLEKLIRKLKLEKSRQRPNEEIDATNYSQVVKKHKTEKVFRRELIELDQEEHRIKEMRAIAELKHKEIEETRNAMIKKKEHLELLRKKAKARQELLENQKNIMLSSSPARLKPKFVEIEEFYKVNVEYPEIARAKAELAKRRSFLQPLSRDDLSNHAKRYNECIEEAKRKRDIKLDGFKLERDVNEVNLFRVADKIEQDEEKNIKKAMRERRKQYGELVRELFGPKIELKPLVIEKQLEKPSPLKIDTRTGSTPPSAPIPKIFKKKLTQKPESTPDPKKLYKYDYLSEQRLKKSGWQNSPSLNDHLLQIHEFSDNISNSDKLKNIKHFERLANKEAQKLKNFDPNTKEALAFEEKINELLLKSIRAKADLLENK